MLQGHKSAWAGALMLLATVAPVPLQAQEVCRSSGPKFSTAVMSEPSYGAVELASDGKPAAKNLVLASQDIVVNPRISWLAAPVVLVDAEGNNLASGVPLGRGAPISQWRDFEDGEIRNCAIGWKNGLFGGATGDGHMRWVCLEDTNGDGAFDNAWRPYSKSMGLSYRRLDIALPTPVAMLTEQPADAEVRTHANASLGAIEVKRTIVVDKITAAAITLESRVRTSGSSRRLERVELAADRPGEVVISGIRVTLTPVAGGPPLLVASGAFVGDEAKLSCFGTQFNMGKIASRTEFAFPNW